MENSNTIEFNNKGGNNPISSLSFHWKAIFSDGSMIEQFNIDNTENKFQLVKDRFNDLAYFNLSNKKGILRICAGENPSSNTEPERWKEVGFCDSAKKIKCWLDTDSVKESIKE